VSARDVNRNLQAWADRMKAALFALGQTYGAKMEAEAKRPKTAGGAPWEDRTGHARQGLHGGAVDTGEAIVAYVAHSVDYGVYLELAMQQRYAILEPTVKRNAPAFFEEARQVVGGR